MYRLLGTLSLIVLFFLPQCVLYSIYSNLIVTTFRAWCNLASRDCLWRSLSLQLEWQLSSSSHNKQIRHCMRNDGTVNWKQVCILSIYLTTFYGISKEVRYVEHFYKWFRIVFKESTTVFPLQIFNNFCQFNNFQIYVELKCI